MLLSSNAIAWIDGPDHQDGKDVELVSREVVVEKVPRISVGQPKFVPATMLLAD